MRIHFANDKILQAKKEKYEEINLYSGKRDGNYQLG